MGRKLFGFAATALMVLSAGSARAVVMLSFDPADQYSIVGEQVEVDVVISGLGSFAPDSLGAFDLTVAFDDSILDFAGLSFGAELDLFGLGSLTGFSEDPNPFVGALEFFEISLDLPSDLDTFQPDSFILAALTFDAVTTGVSAISFNSVALSDSVGNSLTATVSSGSIAVVSEPGTFALLGIGLASLGRRWRR